LIVKINEQYDSLLAIKSSDFSSTLGAVKNMFYLSDIIAVVTLIIASAILINTFLMSVNERTKEIGILNAIGWPRGMIVYIFIVESIFLALIGGLLGFLISLGMLIYIKAAFANISFYPPLFSKKIDSKERHKKAKVLLTDMGLKSKIDAMSTKI